jgi:hypothetical protein
MSENNDYWQLAAAIASSPSTNNNSIQILSHQSFAPTLSEFSSTYNESLTSLFRAVRTR